MKRFARSLCIAVVAISSATLAAQPLKSTAERLREDPDRAAAVHHSYEYVATPDTPAPAGYTPFYVSHYGRHGSRRSLGSNATAAFEYLTKAKEAGILTPLGEQCLADVEKVTAEHEGMVGDLTERGGREHRAIAGRLYDRVPGVFAQRTDVDVQSSNIPRCLISMANFTDELDNRAPQVRYHFITGQKYINLLAHDYQDGQTVSLGSRRLQDSLLKVKFNPDRLIKSLFRGSAEAVAAVIDNPHRFCEKLYHAGGIDQCVETGTQILTKYFTPEELLIQYEAYNVRCYVSMANSEEYGRNVLWAPAQGLLQDFIDRAEAAIRPESNRAADLRFGHDTGILPLAGLMGLEGPGDRMPALAANPAWQAFERIPMASNLQLIFYRAGDDVPVLVKFLYNEQEVRIPTLKPISGPYYRWSDVKAWFEARISQYR